VSTCRVHVGIAVSVQHRWVPNILLWRVCKITYLPCNLYFIYYRNETIPLRFLSIFYRSYYILSIFFVHLFLESRNVYSQRKSICLSIDHLAHPVIPCTWILALALSLAVESNWVNHLVSMSTFLSWARTLLFSRLLAFSAHFGLGWIWGGVFPYINLFFAAWGSKLVMFQMTHYNSPLQKLAWLTGRGGIQCLFIVLFLLTTLLAALLQFSHFY